MGRGRHVAHDFAHDALQLWVIAQILRRTGARLTEHAAPTVRHHECGLTDMSVALASS